MAPFYSRFITLSLMLPFAFAQFPPTPQGVTTMPIKSHLGVSISYKPTTICETTAKAWAGYVHMPISYLQDIETSDPYNISMFFWYIQARNSPETASTGIYLAGGPGESSLYGATSDGGPCNIYPDSNSTYENPFSMNEFVNMLYIDQPEATGFSYDVLVKSVADMLSGSIVPFAELAGHVPKQNQTTYYGVFPSQNPLHTANTTAVAAATLWKFMQIWFANFPERNTCNELVSIWGNSYGGYWVPATAAYTQKQNTLIKQGKITGAIIPIDNIGFTNGCIDILYQGEWYPHVAYDNVYNFQVISKKAYQKALRNWAKPGGCRDLTLQCRELGQVYDPNEFGINATVNQLCVEATGVCFEEILNVYTTDSLVGNRSQFDMAHLLPDPYYPHQYAAGFFNRAWVQKDLGVPVNFTADSNVVTLDFLTGTGDLVRRAGMNDIEYLLDAGVKVTLIYGDRDYRCPWLGVEKLSLAANWTGASAFRSSGYEAIQTNGSYNGGVVRQHGNFSFSRVFQAGHDAYAYQPQTVFQIFNRALSNLDIATGKISTAGSGNNYSSTGPLSSDGIKEKLPSPPPVSCYLYMVGSTCTVGQYLALENGTAEIEDFTIVKPAGGGGPIPGPGF